MFTLLRSSWLFVTITRFIWIIIIANNSPTISYAWIIRSPPSTLLSSLPASKLRTAFHYSKEQLQFSKQPSSFDETGDSPKNIVSILTTLVNRFVATGNTEPTPNELSSPPPTTAMELMSRIQDDYQIRNYLWTGNIDLMCFEEGCRFQDPTISFTSRSTFVRNTKNLKQFVDVLATNTKSDLLSISLCNYEEDDKGNGNPKNKNSYIESRWNMVGDLTGLPWKPSIDVIGRTKFWYRQNETGEFQIYFYDESWEIPAATALMQLIVPKKQNRS